MITEAEDPRVREKLSEILEGLECSVGQPIRMFDGFQWGYSKKEIVESRGKVSSDRPDAIFYGGGEGGSTEYFHGFRVSFLSYYF